MIPSKENVLEILKNVVCFPKGDNIVSLNMVDDIRTDEWLIRFNLVVDDPKDEKNRFMMEAAQKLLNDEYGGVTVEIMPVPARDNVLAKVKHIILVASGKGGVGKSTVAVNLAVGLASQGMNVGLLDADIYGPSVPVMFGIEGVQPEAYERDGRTFMVPVTRYGVKIMSIGNMVGENTPLIWRGPMASSALNQLMTETDWGEIDYMVVDMPPGTGDIQISLAQNYHVDGAVIVTTPQKVAAADVRRAAMMFKHKGVDVPVLGLVENMAYFTPSDMPDKKYFIFGHGNGQKFAEELGVKLLGQIPIDENVASAGDEGKPFRFGSFSPVTVAFEKLAKTIIEMVK